MPTDSPAALVDRALSRSDALEAQTVQIAPHALGPSRSPGLLDEHHDDAAAAAGRAEGQGGPERRRARGARQAGRRAGQSGCEAAAGQSGHLQRFLVRARRAELADLARRRPGGWPRSRPDRCGAAPRGRGAGGTRAGGFSRGPQRLRAVHHAGTARRDAARVLQPQLPDRPDARLRRDQRRDDPRRAHHPARDRRRAARRDPQLDGQLARPLGRRHARRRDDQLQRQGARAVAHRVFVRREPAPDRALQADRTWQHRLRIHRRRSGVLHAEVDRFGADGPASTGRSSSTPATRAITEWAASSRAPEPRNRAPKGPPTGDDRHAPPDFDRRVCRCPEPLR